MNKLLLSALLLSLAAPAQAIEMYRAQEIQPYQAQEIQPYRAQEAAPHRADTVRPYQAQEIEPYRGQEAVPAPASPEPGFRGQMAVPVTPPPGDASGAAANQTAAKQRKSAGAKALFGVWQTNIPGAVYTTPSGLAGYDTLHVSSGAAAGLFRLNANGTYSWNSYGGKKGKWVASNDPQYPVEIIDTVENRRWKVGYDSTKRTLIIWSGSFWYEGRRASLK